MITSVVQQQTWKDHLASLEFVTVFFSWLFMLMTRLAEPFLMLATIYIISETAVPGLHSTFWENACITVMVTAPELVLPGSFVVARHAKKQQEPLAEWLSVMCWAFVILLVATLADVLIFHWQGYWLAALMFLRCSVAVGYSILMRVMQHGKKQEIIVAAPQQIALPQPLENQAPVTQILIKKISVKSLNRQAISGFISLCSATGKEPENGVKIQAEIEEEIPEISQEKDGEIEQENESQEQLEQPAERNTEELEILPNCQKKQYRKYTPGEAIQLPICRQNQVSILAIKAAIKSGKLKTNSEGKFSENALANWIKSSRELPTMRIVK